MHRANKLLSVCRSCERPELCKVQTTQKEKTRPNAQEECSFFFFSFQQRKKMEMKKASDKESGALIAFIIIRYLFCFRIIFLFIVSGQLTDHCHNKYSDLS